jgi:hypothetical protein
LHLFRVNIWLRQIVSRYVSDYRAGKIEWTATNYADIKNLDITVSYYVLRKSVVGITNVAKGSEQ